MNLIVSQIRHSTGSYIFPRRRVMGMIKGSDKGEGNLTREGKCGSVVVLVVDEVEEEVEACLRVMEWI